MIISYLRRFEPNPCQDCLLLSKSEEGPPPGLLERYSCWPACVALRWYWSSGAGERPAASLRFVDDVDGINQGIAIPKQHNPESQASNRES